jgi:hypothetical protein
MDELYRLIDNPGICIKCEHNKKEEFITTSGGVGHINVCVNTNNKTQFNIPYIRSCSEYKEINMDELLTMI